MAEPATRVYDVLGGLLCFKESFEGHGGQKAQPRVLPNMMEWLRRRSLPTRRVLVYAAAVTLAFVLATGVGAMGTLLLLGNLDLPRKEEPRSLAKQENAARSQEKDTAEQEKEAARPSEQEELAAPQPEQEKEAAGQQSEDQYLNQVGDIQSNCVEISLDSHEKLLRYDMLTTDDLAEMQVNKSALRECTNQVNELDPPQGYGSQYEVFRSAINELHEAAQLAYSLVAFPTAATKTEFDAYDRRVSEAASRLQQSNESLGRDYRTLGDVQEISPL
jgi:hypothetical protein